MAAVALVLCEACHRPQFRNQPTCVGCGAALPEAPVAKAELRSARDALLEPYQPFLEADFGGGRLLLLSEKQLEWRAGSAPPLIAELKQLASARVRTRPVWEALLPAVLCGAGALLLAPWAARWAAGVFAAVWALAALTQRRCALGLTMKDGRSTELPWGIGSAAVARAHSVWETVGPELERLGVRAPPLE